MVNTLEFTISKDTHLLIEGGEQMVKLLSLFSGIGAFEKALTNLEIPFELIAYCEFDKYASKAYSVIHNVPETMNLGDITKVDEKTLPTGVVDILTYGFPCQPFSVAGKQEGFDDSKGRGNLFFDALRIIQHCKPKIAIAENVKNLAGKKFEKEFQIVLQSLENAGYNNYWKILDAKDYDLAQHRERVICVSIRKDIDTGIFEFPKPVKLVKCLYDYLEKEVDEKYYIPDDKAKSLIPQLKEKMISNAIRGGAWFNRQTSMGFGCCHQGVMLSKCGTKIDSLTDYANTLLARDFKGFGNQAMNGVIEFDIE